VSIFSSTPAAIARCPIGVWMRTDAEARSNAVPSVTGSQNRALSPRPEAKKIRAPARLAPTLAPARARP
jgi:hypothetical protein